MALPTDTKLASPLPLDVEAGASAPDLIHLLPAGEITTGDGRGPYRVRDMAALIASSLAPGQRLPVDENHATDLAAPKGAPAPARGWIVELLDKPDGLWGRVEWTEAGRQLVTGREYRHISPVIRHTPDGAITHVQRASLVNRPNLNQLTALHAADGGEGFLNRLRLALSLAPDAEEAEILDTFRRTAEERTSGAERIVQLLTELRSKLGLGSDASERHIFQKLDSLASDLDKLRNAARLHSSAEPDVVLQVVRDAFDPAKMVPVGQVVAIQAEFREFRETVAREKAEAVVDAAIRAGKIAAPKVQREHYVSRHMADPAAVERELGYMVSLSGRGSATGAPPPPSWGKAGQHGLDAGEAHLVSLMGIDPESFRKTRDALGEESAL